MQTRGGERGANGAKSVPDHLFYSEQIRNGVGNKCHLWLILIDGKLSKIAHKIHIFCYKTFIKSKLKNVHSLNVSCLIISKK